MSKGKKSRSRRSTGKKKQYRSPELTVHGDIRTLTQGGVGSKKDGGSTGPKTKATGSVT